MALETGSVARAGRSFWLPGWLTGALAAVAVGILLSTFGVGVVAVHGHSMAPTLHDGDRALVIRADAWLHRLGIGGVRPGQVVFFPDPTQHPRGLARWFGRTLLIKRVVAGPGTEVGVVDGRLTVDGVPRAEPYLGNAFRGRATVPPLTVPPERVFVMGDNRRPLASFDSRSFGPVERRSLLGRAVWVVWPLVRVDADGWHWNVHRIDASPP